MQMALKRPERYDQIKSLSSPSEMVREFLSLYPRRNLYIQRLPEQERWSQKKGVLRDYQLLGVIEDGGRGLWRGCYWGEYTKYAVLDIDAGGRYHDPISLEGIKEVLLDIDLRVVAYQSSASRGWHVYIPFTDWVSSEEVEITLKKYLKKRGYELKGGILEIFPSGNALRLPLQPGFAWLNENGEVETRREEIRRDEALRRFLTDLQTKESNWSEAKDRIERKLAQEVRHREAISTEGFEELGNNGQIKERIEEARFYLDNGLTEKGQRHDAIYAIEHLLWYGDAERGVPKLAGSENDERRERFLKEWLEKNHNENCRHVKRGNWKLLEGHIRRACEWRGRDCKATYEKTPYAVTEKSIDVMVSLTKSTGHLWTPEDLERANQKREKEAREKIREAVEQFEREGRRITIKGLSLCSGCDRKTVRKHSDIYRIYSRGLSKWGSHIDPGGRGAGLDASEVLTSSSEPSKAVQSNKNNYSSSGCESDTVETNGQTEVAPLLSFLAEEPTTSSQSQNQDLEAGLNVLTPGPDLRGIQSGKAGVQGGIFVCPPGGSFAVAELFRAGVCLSGPCLFFPRRTSPRLERPGQIVSLWEGTKSITTVAVYTEPGRCLREIATPHKPERGGVLVVGSGCTQLPDKGFRVLDYNRTRGPPEG